jgi:hypothetical protein
MADWGGEKSLRRECLKIEIKSLVAEAVRLQRGILILKIVSINTTNRFESIKLEY